MKRGYPKRNYLKIIFLEVCYGILAQRFRKQGVFNDNQGLFFLFLTDNIRCDLPSEMPCPISLDEGSQYMQTEQNLLLIITK